MKPVLRRLCKIAVLTLVFLVVFEVLAQARVAIFGPAEAPTQEGAR